MFKKVIFSIVVGVLSYAGLSSSAFAGPPVPSVPIKVVSLTSIGGAFFDPPDWEIDTVNSFSVQYLCGGDNCTFRVSNRNFNDDIDYICPEDSVVAISHNAIHIPEECDED